MTTDNLDQVLENTHVEWSPGTRQDAEAVFDAAFYYRTYPEVQEAGIDAWLHFTHHGDSEGRSPFEGFDPRWYAQAARLTEGTTGAFAHFCEIGNFLAIAPNSDLRAAWLQTARDRFDPDFYLDQNPDVAEAGIDPWDHFTLYGAHEGRDPSADFQTQFYLSTYIAPHLPNPQDAFLCNALVHHDLIGKALGFVTTRPEAPAEAPAPVPTPAPAPLTEAAPPAEGQKPARLSLMDYIAAQAPFKERQARLAREQALQPFDRLMESSAFNTEYYRAVSGEDGPREAMVAHYLMQGAAAGLDPSPEFSGAFYRKHYARLPRGLSLPDMEDDTNPLLHYLDVGKPLGAFPNPTLAHLEVEVIRASGRFNADFYTRQLQRKPIIKDIVADYVFYGHMEGYSPSPDIDVRFVRKMYAEALDMQMHDPLSFFLRRRSRIWVYASQAELEAEAAAIRACADFDASYYARLAGLVDGTVDPAQHYALFGLKDALPASPVFDTEYYLTTYPDLARTRVNPLLHFHRNGRGEGRVAKSEIVAHHDAPKTRSFDPDLSTVVIYTHEFSLTGAPIVALNLARRFMATNNVIVWCGKHDGPLFKDFSATAVAVYTGWASTTEMAEVLSELKATDPLAVALVNSVVCAPVLPSLLLAGLPTVTLIHEFANYVYPTGTLSKAALVSDVAVFPASIVQDACEAELARIGSRFDQHSFRIRPQGYNGSKAVHSEYTTEQVKRTILLDGSNPKARVLFGAGQVQPRKGVDLFLQAAQKLLAENEFDWRFIWVGGGYDPERDMTTSVYLEHQIAKSGLSEHLYMFDEQSSLEPFWDIADVFFLSSRMDPFPNVALDALERNIPVVCFRGSTGIADIEEQFPFAVNAVPFVDIDSAARAIGQFARTTEVVTQTFAGAEGVRLKDSLSFEAYVDDITGMIASARTRRDDVEATRQQLDSVTSGDVGRALLGIPPLLRLVPFDHDALNRLSLSVHLTRDSVAVPYTTEAGVEGLQLHGDFAGICGARYGNAFGGPVLRDIAIHFHARDEAALLSLLDARSWTSRWLSSLRSFVTVSDRHTLGKLSGNLPPRVTLLDTIHANAVDALEAVIASPAFIEDMDGKQSFVAHCNLRAGLKSAHAPREVLDCLLSVTSGSAVEYLTKTPDAAAVFPAVVLYDDSHKVHEAFVREMGHDARHPHAPWFNGVYRLDTLSAFFAREDAARHRRSGLSEDGKAGLAALMFANFCTTQAGLRMVSTVRVHE